MLPATQQAAAGLEGAPAVLQLQRRQGIRMRGLKMPALTWITLWEQTQQAVALKQRSHL